MELAHKSNITWCMIKKLISMCGNQCSAAPAVSYNTPSISWPNASPGATTWLECFLKRANWCLDRPPIEVSGQRRMLAVDRKLSLPWCLKEIICRFQRPRCRSGRWAVGHSEVLQKRISDFTECLTKSPFQRSRTLRSDFSRIHVVHTSAHLAGWTIWLRHAIYAVFLRIFATQTNLEINHLVNCLPTVIERSNRTSPLMRYCCCR